MGETHVKVNLHWGGKVVYEAGSVLVRYSREPQVMQRFPISLKYDRLQRIFRSKMAVSDPKLTVIITGRYPNVILANGLPIFGETPIYSVGSLLSFLRSPETFSNHITIIVLEMYTTVERFPLVEQPTDTEFDLDVGDTTYLPSLNLGFPSGTLQQQAMVGVVSQSKYTSGFGARYDRTSELVRVSSNQHYPAQLESIDRRNDIENNPTLIQPRKLVNNNNVANDEVNELDNNVPLDYEGMDDNFSPGGDGDSDKVAATPGEGPKNCASVGVTDHIWDAFWNRKKPGFIRSGLPVDDPFYGDSRCDLENLMWLAATENQLKKFRQRMEQIKTLSHAAHLWLANLSLEKWTMHKDDGYRWGVLTTNIHLCYYGLLMKACGLSVTAIVRLTFKSIIDRFDERCRLAVAQIQVFEIRTFADAGKGGNVQVLTGVEKKCTCGKWRNYHMPCSHAIKSCHFRGIEPRDYISEYYSCRFYKLTCNGKFFPLSEEAHWPPSPFNLLANTKYERTEGVQHIARSRMGRSCGNCKQTGHNRTRCPKNP
ncbi:hypothetical protein RDI58_018573 [Solanum bulbocastanum]|uniref:SWIM-type domain-containing protein n=1 Tax=Solanum bulbocastanum TaxID=147425 RepID=A0AAN8TAV7_SOLBU